MPGSSDEDRDRRRTAVEREMQRRREAEDRRAERELVDTVEDEQARERERADDD